MKWTDAKVAEFRERGYLFIESLFSPEEVGVLNAELPGILARRGPENLREQKSDAVRSAIAPHLYNEPFRQLSRHPRLIEPARQVLGGPVYLHQFKINAKRAHDGEIWHWHQDYRTWYEDDGMPRPDIINAALFLDDVTEFNGPMMFIPGSHKARAARGDAHIRPDPGLRSPRGGRGGEPLPTRDHRRDDRGARTGRAQGAGRLGRLLPRLH